MRVNRSSGVQRRLIEANRGDRGVQRHNGSHFMEIRSPRATGEDVEENLFMESIGG